MAATNAEQMALSIGQSIKRQIIEFETTTGLTVEGVKLVKNQSMQVGGKDELSSVKLILKDV